MLFLTLQLTIIYKHGLKNVSISKIVAAIPNPELFLETGGSYSVRNLVDL